MYTLLHCYIIRSAHDKGFDKGLRWLFGGHSVVTRFSLSDDPVVIQ
jgi:hypothetical protein